MPYDRTTEDVGNIVEFGHVNTRVPDQRLATLFYISGLGLTRDPYLVTGVENMWVNAGTTQFHLPTGPAQVLGGVTVLAVPDLAALRGRLGRVAPLLADTEFGFAETEDGIAVTSPWGNRLRCVASRVVRVGILAVEFDVAPGAAAGIARFYSAFLGTPAAHAAGTTFVTTGLHTRLIFRETDGPLAPYDGSHIQIALADFSGPHALLRAGGLITEESSQHQYRFENIIDPETGAVLCSVEHEVRSMRHPMYARALVNRDPGITNNHYSPGHEALAIGPLPGDVA